MSRRTYDDLPGPARRRLLLQALVRPTLCTTVLLVLYYLLPLDGRFTIPTAVSLTAGLAVVAALLTWQVWRIRMAKYPRLRAIEAVAISLPLFILVFAAAYFAMAHNSPTSFSEGLNRTDSLYFAVTVFASVGFGDITAVTQGARVMVMIQMVGDLVMVGVVVRVIAGAVQSGLRHRESGGQPG